MNSRCVRILGCALLAFVAVSALAGCTGRKLVLVADGRSRARIVVGDDVCPVARFAAKELQTYVKESTGAELAIATALSEDGSVDIVVGAGKIAQQLGVAAEGLQRDAFVMRAVGNRIVILGRDDPAFNIEKALGRSAASGWHHFEHATVFGVYDFLERYVGVRWYLPVDIGEVVPRRATLVVPAMDVIDAPAKISRNIHTRYGADDRDDPMPRKDKGRYRGGFYPGLEGQALKDFARRRQLFFMRMRHETVSIASNHSTHKLISPQRFGKTRPDFFALFKNGKRGANFDDPPHSHHCYSNDDMIEVLIEDAKAYFRGDDAKTRGLRSWRGIGWETQRGKCFNILQSDGFRPCTCEKCEAAKRPGVKGSEAYSDLVWSAVFKLAAGVKDEFPNCVISGTAYGPMKTPPSMPFPDNVIVSRIAVAGPYSEFIPGRLEMEKERIRKWTRLVGKDRMGFYHYAGKGGWNNGHFASHKSVCGSVPRAYAACYKRLGEIGLGTYMYMMSYRFAYDHLCHYVFYKYHWGPNRDIDALLNEYYTLFYGPASVPMGKFWEEVEGQFRRTLSNIVETPLGPTPAMADEQDVWGEIYGRPVIDRWNAYFGEAARLAAASDDPVYAKRIAYMKRNVLETVEEGLVEYETLLRDAGKVRYAVRRTKVAPRLDGTLNDPAWRRAKPQPLAMMVTGKPPAPFSSVRMLWDSENLYVAIDCRETELADMKADEVVNDRTRVWRNNGIELFLDPDNKGRTHFQWMCNNKGTWTDSHTYARRKSNKDWNTNFKGKVAEQSDGYVIEIAIPFKSFPAGAPKVGDVWGANVVRKRVRKGQDMQQAVYQTWSPYISLELGFHRGIAFGKLDFVE